MPPEIGPGRTMLTLDDDVVEVARPQARQHRHLRAALDLGTRRRCRPGRSCRTSPDRRRGMLAIDNVTPAMFAQHVEHQMELRQRAEREQVDP
jgi:hypothetical protein